jgi:hypothetical protein
VVDYDVASQHVDVTVTGALDAADNVQNPPTLR